MNYSFLQTHLILLVLVWKHLEKTDRIKLKQRRSWRKPCCCLIMNKNVANGTKNVQMEQKIFPYSFWLLWRLFWGKVLVNVIERIHNIEGICERVTRKIKSESQEFISRLESLEIGMGRILVDFLSLNWV